jgi:glucokinase
MANGGCAPGTRGEGTLGAMLLAGDLGGTKTQLGLFRPHGGRPEMLDVREYATLDYPGLSAMISTFLGATGVRPQEVQFCCIGVAGPNVKQVARLTNVPWLIDGRELMANTGIRRAWILNDVEAMAYGVPALRPDELHVLQRGEFNADGNACLMAAGTGLGQAILVRQHGRLLPSPSEGGHADLGPRTPREVALVQFLIAQYGRATYEHVIAGRGFINLLRFTSGNASPLLAELDEAALPAEVSRRGLDGSDPHCVDALDLFVTIYGSAAANLALQCVATGGVFLGGGIPSKILPAFDQPAFMEAFRNKAPMTRLLERMPVAVVLNRQTGLLGAAVYGASLIG